MRITETLILIVLFSGIVVTFASGDVLEVSVLQASKGGIPLSKS